jgi:hypothetical protein
MGPQVLNLFVLDDNTLEMEKVPTSVTSLGNSVMKTGKICMYVINSTNADIRHLNGNN